MMGVNPNGVKILAVAVNDKTKLVVVTRWLMLLNLKKIIIKFGKAFVVYNKDKI